MFGFANFLLLALFAAAAADLVLALRAASAGPGRPPPREWTTSGRTI